MSTTEAECIRLCVDFANHIDARRYGPLVELFTEDGVLDRMGAVSSGREEIARFLDARPTTMATRHLCTNIRVEQTSAEEATGFCYVLFFQGVPGGPGEPAMQSGAPAVVQYHDRYRLTVDGWRIGERRIRMAMKP